jgi:hypothetical protein
MPNVFALTAASLHREISAIIAAPVLSGENTPLQSLRASIDVQAQAAVLVAAAAERARDARCTWQEIGDVLGISRQAAFQRFGKPIDPRTGETMSTTPLPEAVALAETVLDALASGAWGDVTSHFDEQMRNGLTSDGLAAAWAQIVGMAGAYEHRGKTEAARAADITITNTPLAFEAGDFTARISFRDDQTIAGLYIVPTEPQSLGS